MAISITNANANISDTTLTYSLTFTGRTGTNVTGQILVNGTVIGSANTTSTSSVSVTFTTTNLWNAATGSALSGAVTFRVNDYDAEAILLGSSSKTGGTVTIARRLTSAVYSTANPYNLDSITALSVSWTRPHTAFRGRVKLYVNGTLILTRTGFNTSMTYTPTSGEIADMVTAMGGVSPRYIWYVVETGFVADTTVYYTSGALTTPTATNTVIKTFYTLSTISISSFTLTVADMNVPFTLNQTGGPYTHTVKLYVNGSVVKTQTGVTTSGNFAIDSTARTDILTAMANTTSATCYADVTTETYGTTDSSGVSTTCTLHSDFKPTIGTVTWAEAMAYVKTALGYTTGTAFFLKSKSKVTFTVPVTLITGGSLSSIRVQFAGTDKTQATSPVTTDFLNAYGTLSYTIRATDSRGRFHEVTAGSIVVRNYIYPTIPKFEVYRAADGSTAYDPLGTYLRFIYSATSTSVLALDGTTELNWVRVRVDEKTTSEDPSLYTNILSTSGTTLTIGETTSAQYSTYATNTAYNIRIRVYDKFYDLDNNGGVLIDSDDYSENMQILPFGKVALYLGPDYAAIGKVWNNGTLDVGGSIYSNGLLVPVALTSGSTSVGALQYNGTTQAAGQLYGGTTIPTETTRLNYSGYFYPTQLNLLGTADTVDTASHYFVETGTDGFLRPKTLANVRTEIVTSAAVESAYILAKGTASGQTWIKYSDGTLIKYGNFDLTIAIATAFGNIFLCAVQTLTYDTTVPFVTTNPVVVMSSTDSTANDRTSQPLLSTGGLTTQKFQLWRATSQASQTWKVNWFAIGRWV